MSESVFFLLCPMRAPADEPVFYNLLGDLGRQLWFGHACKRMSKACGDPSLFPLKGRIGNINRISIDFWIFRMLAKQIPIE